MPMILDADRALQGCDNYNICAKLYEVYYFNLGWCEELHKKRVEKVAARRILCTYVVIFIINLSVYCFIA